MRRQKERISLTSQLMNARKWRCMAWSRLNGYFKDSLTKCYRIQSTKIAILFGWPVLISHQWDWAWCTSNQIWFFLTLLLSPTYLKSLCSFFQTTRFFRKQNTCDSKWRVLEFKVLFFLWEIFYSLPNCLILRFTVYIYVIPSREVWQNAIESNPRR